MADDLPEFHGLTCPVPITRFDKVILGHGSGGKLSHDLFQQVFLPPFDNPILRASDDAGIVQIGLTQPPQHSVYGRLAISTDTHVVWPLFFPGGDIGRLAVCGTVNDVSMMGAKPLYLTAGFVLEEGLDLTILKSVVASMKEAAAEAEVIIIAGDTKVVQKGKADGIFINTTGVGIIPDGIQIGGAMAKPGDSVILSGSIGDHGIAVLQARQELGFSSDIQSDVAPLNHLTSVMLEVSDQIHVMRDPTRGGLATCLNEIACQSQVGILIHETQIPVKPGVAAACEMLGLDPNYIANEGKLVAVVDQAHAERVLKAMRKTRLGEQAAIVGEVIDEPKEHVLIRTIIGSTRILDMPSGELLPRIC